jgi:hypothetical protein
MGFTGKVLLFMVVFAAGGIQLCNGAPSATMIQHVSTFSNFDPSLIGNPYFVSLPNPTGAGNALVLGVSYPFATGRAVTVSDDQTNVWTLEATTPSDPTDGQMVSCLYCALNVAPGTQKITITFDDLLYNFQAVVTEFYNVATVAAVDGSSGNSDSSAPIVDGGSLVTSADGDLIYFYGFNTYPTSTLTGFTPAPGFTLLSADVELGWLAQYGIQTNAGGIVPAVTVADSADPFNAVTLALKSANAGTSPNPGIRIVRVCHEMTLLDMPIQFPSSGNLIACNAAYTPVQNDVTITASDPANTWVKVSPSPFAAQMSYAPNANTSPDLRISCQVDWFGASLVLYDITGADVSPYDDGAGIPLVYQENLDNSPLLEMPVITPTTPNGLILAVQTTGFGPVVGMVGDGLMFDSITYGNEIDNDVMDNADGYAHCYNSTTQAVSFGWLMNSSTLPEASTAVAIAFKAATTNTNRPPIPASPTLERYWNAGFKAPESLLLGTDPDGDPVSLISVGPLTDQGGTVSAAQGWVYYTPPAGLTNNDSFDYIVGDGQGGFATGTVTVVMLTNQGPLLNIALSTNSDGSVLLSGRGIPERSYTFEFTPDLQGPNWQPLSTVMSDSVGMFSYMDLPPVGSTTRFYRVITY